MSYICHISNSTHHKVTGHPKKTSFKGFNPLNPSCKASPPNLDGRGVSKMDRHLAPDISHEDLTTGFMMGCIYIYITYIYITFTYIYIYM